MNATTVPSALMSTGSTGGKHTCGSNTSDVQPTEGDSHPFTTCKLCRPCEIAVTARRFRGCTIGTVGDIRARSQCDVCQLIARAIDSSEHEIPPTDLIFLMHCDGSDARMLVRYIGHGGGTSLGEVTIHQPCVQGPFTFSPTVDAEYVKDSLRFCQTNHDHALRACFTRQRAPVDITLIDVEADCLVRRSTRETYLALSYVWGAFHPVTATVETQQDLEVPGSMSSLPIGRLILDAMALTRKLGERYIWIDALCIEQDNASQKHAQINCMDVIYGQAYLTIVATTATSVQSCLPGLSEPLREPTTHAVESGQMLMLRPPNFFSQMEHTVIESRAWTFQERLLSLRCLFMTRDGPIVHCPNSDSWARPGFNKVSRLYQQPIRGQESVGVHSAYYELFDLIEQFSKKSLSYPGDAINAFYGVLNIFQTALGGDMIAGMPENAMDLALLWFETPKGRVRNPLFPSWSWAGWTGPLCYLPEDLRQILKSMVHEYQWNTITPRKTIIRGAHNSLPRDAAQATDNDDSVHEGRPMEVLYFEAEVVSVSDLPLHSNPYPTDYPEVHFYEPVDLCHYAGFGDAQYLDYVLLSAYFGYGQSFVMLVKQSGEYAERVALFMVSPDDWRAAPKRHKKIALR